MSRVVFVPTGEVRHGVPVDGVYVDDDGRIVGSVRDGCLSWGT